MGAKQAGVTGAMEGLQASQGGNFDVENVAIDAVLAGAGEAIPAVMKGRLAGSQQKADELTDAAIAARSLVKSRTQLSPEAQMAQTQGFNSAT